MASGKKIQVQGKVREFYFESRKIGILKKSQAKFGLVCNDLKHVRGSLFHLSSRSLSCGTA